MRPCKLATRLRKEFLRALRVAYPRLAPANTQAATRQLENCAFNFTSLRWLGTGCIGDTYLVRTANGLAALKQSFSADKRRLHPAQANDLFDQEVAVQEVAAAAKVGPRVLATCRQPRQLAEMNVSSHHWFSEALVGRWLDEHVAEAHCPASHLWGEQRPSSPGLAPFCQELDGLLSAMDSHGLMQGDWKLTHILRSADKGGLRVIDFSHASMHNASLPSGANWCVYTSLQLYASRLNDKWLRAAPERCLLRCLLGLGQHSGVLSKETAASIFGARQLATNRHCRQILETVLHMADAGPPATAAEPRRLQPGCSTRATRTHFEMVRHVLDEANRAWGEQHTRK